MGLLTESSPPVNMPVKLVFQEDNHQPLKNSPKFKRAKTDSARIFPMHCGGPSAPENDMASPGFPGVKDRENSNAFSVRTFPMHFGGPSAPEILRASPGFSGVTDIHEISEAATYVAAAIAAKPLRTVAPSEVNNEVYIKLNGADDDRKVESTKRKLNLKNEELPSAILSRKLDWDVLLPKTVDDLSDLMTLRFTSELENTRIPMRASSFFHETPDSLSKAVPLSNGRSNSVAKSFEVKAETNEESDDDDCVIIMEKPNNVSQGNLVEDQLVSSTVTQNNSNLFVQGQPSWKREIKGQIDDEDVVFLCPEEWENILQSGFKRQNKIEKNSRAKYSAGKSSKRSEIYWVEDFTKESMEETEAKDLASMNIVPYDAATNIVSRNNVQKARSLYDELFKSLLHEYKEESGGGKISKQVHVEAAMLLKKEQKWVNVEPTFGHVPGVIIGDQFQFRAELALVGLHHELMAGINYVTIDGKHYAISVVDSGRYENKVKSPNILVYSGQGGNPKFKTKNEDQKLEGGNLALKNSMDAKLPVRVIRKTLLTPDATCKKMYIYDGLYAVNRFWPERSESGKLALMFELVRVSGQPDCYHLTINKLRRSMESHSKAVATYDVSQGKEKIPIMVVNEVNKEKPAPFTYITTIMYPHWYELSVTDGCNCISGCSDSINCPCSVKNNGDLPFNEECAIIEAKPMVYECGPNCKCPPSCQNRVSQHGPRFPLEVFRTKSTGWGVRSQVQIPSGSFICEYIGELLEDKEADQRSNDEYLFDLDDGDGFTIDAAQYGNVGRFINHSCSPNLYAQNVLYDHDDKRLPHIMFFAAKNIPALKELTYDYNYMPDRVHDANGNIKKKECHCGSRKCTRRMY